VSELPSVVIVGRPNVGKSTLFNAITRTRRSIVGDEPGITRDRIYGAAAYRGRPFTLIDTGGIITDDDALIPSEILKQAHVALKNASHVIFLIDGRAEITGADRELAAMLRKLGKPVALAVNKIDSPKREGLTHEFYSLGFKDLFAVSAEHRIGLDDLLEHVTYEFPEGVAEGPAEGAPTDAGSKRSRRRAESDAPIPEAADSEPDTSKPSDVSRRPVPPIKVAIIGRPNVGKSTLLNAFVGAERAIVSPVAGTTRDAVDETVEHKGVEYSFVDTAGIRRKGKTKLMAEKLSVVMARRHLRMCNVALLVLDATEGMLALDATIAGYAHEEGRAIVVVVNKWDQAKMGKRKFAEEIADHLKFLDYAPVAFISAKDREGVMGLYGMIRRAFQSASQRVTTGQLNQFVKTLKWEHGAKIYYMAQVDVRPPKFVAFTDKAQNLHFSAERFLINRLREKFGFEGTPIVLESKRR